MGLWLGMELVCGWFGSGGRGGVGEGGDGDKGWGWGRDEVNLVDIQFF